MQKQHKALYSLGWIFLAILAIVTLSFIAPKPVAAQEGNPVIIYMFWGEGCPHCATAKPYFEDLADKHPEIELRFYEIYNSVENQEKFVKMAEAFGFEAWGVPTIFIGDRYWEGYAETLHPEIEGVISQCLSRGCKDAGSGIIVPAVTESIKPSSTPAPGSPENPGTVEDPVIQNRNIKIPLIGEINLNNQSLFVATLLIAFVDGVNPCSIWVLTMLIALTLHTGSRKRVALIGIIFISITALVYALFIAGLFTFLTFISFVTWIQVVVAIVALVFALVNIKDYFWYKEGVSFTISDEKKPGIFKRMRKILDSSNSLWGVISATVVLAAGVSLVEFSCTAGFPVLWSNMLSAQGVETGEFVLLLLLYMLIYQIDELVIFFVAVFTLKASRLEEKHGRILKLIGGTLMLTLAGVMIFNPNLLNDLNSALVIFAVAFGLTALILLVHRKILPVFGIWVGSEKNLKKKTKKKRIVTKNIKRMTDKNK
ncbi:MAG: thioredoxin family protein [Anaerolineaceae bacterium]|nr:thioredoxin family protein [Anaerolineaceae bacterium]